ncbi:MAG: transporter [Nitriliruptorales bacterium]|nr:transporter [Nitriliruptorales bacterium]
MLLYVGAVLFVNGIWLLGHIQDREVAIINIFTGVVGLTVAILALVEGGAASIQLSGLVLLFAFTYLWVAYNRFVDVDGRGLGWYCLFVAVTAVPVAILTLTDADTPFLTWLGLSWIAWAVLWFLYFLLLALGRPITRIAGWVTIVVGIATAWVPGFLGLTGLLEV